MLDLEHPDHQKYYEDWIQMIDQIPPHATSTCLQVLVFTLDGRYFAFIASSLRKVIKPRIIYPIPHNSKEWLLGLVKAKRRLQLTVDLGYFLLGKKILKPYTQEAFLFLEEDNEAYIFPVGKIVGLQALVSESLLPLSTVDSSLFLGQFMRDKQTVTLICHTGIFKAIDSLLEPSPIHCGI